MGGIYGADFNNFEYTLLNIILGVVIKMIEKKRVGRIINELIYVGGTVQTRPAIKYRIQLLYKCADLLWI